MKTFFTLLVAILLPRLALSPLTDPVTRTVTVDRGAQDPAVSPDGAQIAVGILGKIWLVPIQGGRARQVTFGPSWDAHPAWSADGQFLAYGSQRALRSELVILNLATGGERTVFAVPNAIGHVAFHPTKPQLLFIDDVGQYNAHLWSVDFNAGKSRQLTFGGGSAAERSFDITPDGKAVVLESGGQGTSSVFLLQLDSLRVRRLTPAVGEEFDVHLSRDGKSIIYIERIEGVETIVRRALADTIRRAGFTSEYDGKQLAIHPDGATAILLSARRLNRLDLATGRLSPIPFEATFTLPALGPQDLVITNARLWDATGRAVTENANVEVRAGRITRIWVGPNASATAEVQVIDAKGRMLLPGLMDNHDHWWHNWTFHGASLLGAGVTSIRNPGVEVSEGLNIRDAVRLGTLEGPDVYTLGPLIDGPLGIHPMVDVMLTKADAGPALVRSLKALGVDGIKVYQSLPLAALRAVVAEARAQGLPVSGDISLVVDWKDAIAAGITGLNHANNYQPGLLGPDRRGCHEGEAFQLCRLHTQNAPLSFFDPAPPQLDALVRMMAVRQVAFDPTINRFYRPDERLNNQGVEASDYQRRWYAVLEEFLRKAVAAGVPLLAGTDNDGDELFLNSLNDELELYERAGVPRVAILQSARINGARWLGRQDEFGTIEVGKRAHLLLVDGDPLKQIKDLRNIILVVKDGRIVFRGGQP